MGLKSGTPIVDIPVDRVFIGSCTNSRLDDLRAAAHFVEGKHVAKNIKQALIVPGSRGIKSQAEREGLDKIFRDRKSTRLNSSHSQISYAVFCLKKKTTNPI